MMTKTIYPSFRKIWLFLFIMITVAAVAGCAKQRVWAKKGLNPDELDRDLAKCTREASSATQTANFTNSTGVENGLERDISRDNLVKKCMFSKGYKLEGK